MDEKSLLHLTPESIPLISLDITKQFSQLTEKEQLYAYYMYKASWAGAMIIAQQTSFESEFLIKTFVKFFQSNNVHDLPDTEDINNFLNYVVYVFLNFSNYTAFSHRKFIPRISREKMEEILKDTENVLDNGWLLDKMYSLTPSTLGYPPENESGLFPLMTKEDILRVDEYLKYKGIEAWNTEAQMGTKEKSYEIVIASVTEPIQKKYDEEVYNGYTFNVVYRNHDDSLFKVVNNLDNALKYVANDNQWSMLRHYIKHFKYGDIEDHITSQRYWVDDKGPTVETNIGFIERYRDPSGLRADFESIVAILDKDKSKKYGELVKKAPELLELLPWPKEFEKDTFNSPDFTALDVIAYVSSEIFAGINIPNYPQIRQDYGFKNISLDNIVVSSYKGQENVKLDYLNEDDNKLYKTHFREALMIDVAGHELLGHGSGKLFVEKDGQLNFSKDTINPYTGKPVEQWYKDGETFENKFGNLGSAYEECRAECVGLYLSNFKDFHDIFNTADAWDVSRVVWLWIIRAGLGGLMTYNPDTKEWASAHCQARYVIYSVLKEAGLVNIVMNDEQDNFTINYRDTTGKGIEIIENLLGKLNVYKAIGDTVNGFELFNKYSCVDEEHLKLRSIVIKRRKTFPGFIQPTLKMNMEEKIEVVTYGNTVRDAIQSFVDKYVN